VDHRGGPEDDLELLAAVRAQLIRRAALVGLPIGSAIAVYYALWGPLRRGSPVWAAVVINLVLVVVFGTALTVLGLRAFDRRVARDFTWVAERRRPDTREQAALIGTPAFAATAALRAMLVVAVLNALLNYASGRVFLNALQVFVGIGLTAAILAALAYLIVENVLRPLFVIGLRDWRPKDLPASGIRLRLVVAWALGSAVPLLFIVAIPGRGHAPRLLPITVPMEFMAVTGLVLGLVTTVLVARSVSDPLARVRSGLRRVQEGDLDAEIPVDNGGEVGWLEAAFNDMVVGLRERRRIEQLFGGYVGADVAQHALEQGVVLGGEIRSATALFVDVVDSTGLAQREDPEQVVAMLNDFFSVVAEAVAAEGGWINKFEGDAALCVFGAPAPQPDHAARALRAARRLRQGLAAVGERWPGFAAGVGVSTGAVVAGNVGTKERHEYTVIGDAVNEAARLTSVAKGLAGQVAASGSAVAAAGDEAARWRLETPVVLRGRRDATDVFAIADPA
jgi:adenylate cyclase